MAVVEHTDADDATYRLAGRTTISLYESDDGRWRATQRGVGAVGYGETAAEAATAYCRRVDGLEA